MSGAAPDLGTAAWSARTGGHLSAADKRSLLGPLARTHVVNAAGRLGMAVGRRPGKGRRVAPDLFVPPQTTLTRVAKAYAVAHLTPALLNHSERMYAYGAALAALESVEADLELLYAACLLHDVGLSAPAEGVDFTVTSAAVAAQIAEDLGLSAAATETIGSAITLHHSPGVGRERHGAVAYLASAGAAVDVVGFRMASSARRRRPGRRVPSPDGVQGRVRRPVASGGRPCPGRPSTAHPALRRVRARHPPLSVRRLSGSRIGALVLSPRGGIDGNTPAGYAL